jgi:hypothetical protein
LYAASRDTAAAMAANRATVAFDRARRDQTASDVGLFGTQGARLRRPAGSAPGTTIAELDTITMSLASEDRSPRRTLVGLCLFTGLAASANGLAFVLRPDGSWQRAPFSLLEHAPFPDFFLPGLLLWALVGLSNLIAVAALVSLPRRRLAATLALVGGAAVTGFVVGEMLLLRRMSWLQVFHLAVGLATIAQALSLRTFRQRLQPKET